MNDCSDSFKTRQGLRQGDILSTLLFNIILEAIVRRAKLQTTTGTIFNKQIQLLTYAGDINTVSRSLEAVRDAYLALEAEAAKVVMTINELIQNTRLRAFVTTKNDVCLDIPAKNPNCK
jgi:hypothetical protein